MGPTGYGSVSGWGRRGDEIFPSILGEIEVLKAEDDLGLVSAV